jgi:3-methyl-2-oxobutanoate hydroxymethyltransferase
MKGFGSRVWRCIQPSPASSFGRSTRRSLASKVSALSLTSKKRHGHKISMVTAYDFPSAVHVARAGIDVVLMGDSLAMVELGFATTQPIDVDPMIWHCASVKRGIDYAASAATTADYASPLLVGDMPFGSYEFDDSDIALRNAYRFVKEGGVDAVKLEVRTTRRSDKRRLTIFSSSWCT